MSPWQGPGGEGRLVPGCVGDPEVWRGTACPRAAGPELSLLGKARDSTVLRASSGNTGKGGALCFLRKSLQETR